MTNKKTSHFESGLLRKKGMPTLPILILTLLCMLCSVSGFASSNRIDPAPSYLNPRLVAMSTPLTNGRAMLGLSGAVRSERFFMITVPKNKKELLITTSISGNFDTGLTNNQIGLYVSLNAMPVKEYHGWGSQVRGGSQAVRIKKPAAGTYFICVYGMTGYQNLRLTATYK